MATLFWPPDLVDVHFTSYLDAWLSTEPLVFVLS
jgi:hypothetical protein